MNELIKVMDREGIQTVNARELHGFLESKREFSTWIKDRIEKFNFEENSDYTRFDNFVKGDKNGFGNKTIKEYYISLDMAKELSMVENNDKGRQARQYFIKIEKGYKTETKELKKIETMFMAFMQQQSEMNKTLLAMIGNQKALPQLTDVKKMTISEYFKKEKVQSYNYKALANATGRQATRLSKEMNRTIQYRFNNESGYNEGLYDEDLLYTALIVAKKILEEKQSLFQ